VGKPNVGKSSLLNLLVGQDRAIVTEIAGTTRDVLEEQINLNGIILNLMDTAGIRDTEDVVERIGVDRARDYAAKADLVIYVIDASSELDGDDYEIIKLLSDKQAVILLNKSDLSVKITEEDIKERINKPIISFSAKENKGLKNLEETISHIFFRGELKYNDEIFSVNVRQKNSLKLSLDYLLNVIKSVEDGMPEDFYSIDLMGAYEELGKIIGESVEDDLVEEIFSKFCMGK
jgi:tRNA modification GTPase